MRDRMWPFKASQIVDRHTAAWHVENFAWLVHQFGGCGAFERSRLVLPTRGFFPTSGETGHALALRIFEQVKDYCGLASRRIPLIADDNPLAARPSSTSPISVEGKKHAAGTYYESDLGAEITYVPALLDRPQSLIAVFAHELSHYLLATSWKSPICEPHEEEFLTDLTAVYLGFGVFMANARLEHDANGAVSSQGYLPQPDLVFGLALYLRAKEIDPGPALGALKPHLAVLLRRALKAMPPDDPAIVDIKAHRRDAESREGRKPTEKIFRIVK